MQNLARKRRVLVLTSTFPRWQDDTEPRFVLDLCRHLAEHVDIVVLAPHTGGAALDESIEGVPVRRFRYFLPAWQAVTYQGGIISRLRENPWRVLQLPFFFAAFWWSALRLIRSWKPDIIHAHWVIPQGLVACLFARHSRPVLCTSHGSDLHGLQSRVFRILKRWTLKRCCAVTVVSRSLANKVEALAFETPVEVIPMGTDLKLLFTPSNSQVTRQVNEIIFVGRLVETKGLRYLLEAFASVQRAQPDLVLTIVGDGPMRDEVRRLTAALGQKRNVRLLGGVRQTDLPAIYRRAALAVFPYSDQEGFGLVVVEAMGCGCPVIASDLPAIREIVEPGVTGILTPPGDSAALTDALRRCLDDEALRSRLATAALASVRQQFDWPSIAARYSKTIEDCIRR